MNEKVLSQIVRRMTHKQLCDLIRGLWNYDPFTFGKLRRAMLEVGQEDIAHAQENQEKP